jgi:hypothetical protein
MTSLNAQMAGRWFQRVLWFGIVANLGLAIPTMLAPARMLVLSGLPDASPVLWTQFSGLLLVLLSVFYMPAGVDLDRYRAVAWLAVGARLAGGVFFVGFQPSAYHRLGYFDLAFFVPEITLLTAAMRQSALVAHGSPMGARR